MFLSVLQPLMLPLGPSRTSRKSGREHHSSRAIMYTRATVNGLCVEIVVSNGS